MPLLVVKEWWFSTDRCQPKRENLSVEHLLSASDYRFFMYEVSGENGCR